MFKRIFLGVVIVAAALALLSACSKQQPSATTSPPSARQASASSHEPIAWVYDYQTALKTAAREKKPIMIDFYTDWCSWCKKLDEDTYPDPKVQELAKKFVCAKINAEKDTATARKYGVSAYPTIVFTDAEGKELHRVESYQTGEVFVQTLEEALSKAPKA